MHAHQGIHIIMLANKKLCNCMHAHQGIHYNWRYTMGENKVGAPKRRYILLHFSLSPLRARKSKNLLLSH
jgi:hypothetical protein